MGQDIIRLIIIGIAGMETATDFLRNHTLIIQPVTEGKMRIAHPASASSFYNPSL